MELGEKIKNLRKNQKMSQEKLASYLHINRNHLSRIETGKSEPTSSMLKTIGTIFDINLNSLLDISNDKEQYEEKIKYVVDNCRFLLDNDLDFIVRIISVMREEYVKKNKIEGKEEK